MRRRTAMACAVLAVLTAAPAGAAEQPPAAPGEAVLPLFDPAGENLLEAPFTNRGQELLVESGATNGLCRTLEQLDELEEPRADDGPEIETWAAKYYSNLRLFDDSGKVTDPDSGDEVRVPRELVEAIGKERRSVFAFLRRVQSANVEADAGTVSEEQLQPRLDYAFVALANSEFDVAHRQLLAAGRRYC